MVLLGSVILLEPGLSAAAALAGGPTADRVAVLSLDRTTGVGERLDSAAVLGRDEIANMAIRDAHEIVGFLDDADEILADGTEGGLFLLALGVLALEQQRDELRRQVEERG